MTALIQPRNADGSWADPQPPTEEGVKATHKVRVYPEDQYFNSFAYRCSCGNRDGGFAHREYARDAWREAHGLEPKINRPLV